MNRRGFFRRTLGAMAAAVCAPLLANGIVAPDYFDDGHPITVGPDCPNGTVYYLNHDGPYRITCAPDAFDRLTVTAQQMR